MPYIVYILECSDGSYYTGSTDDINKRLWQHEQGVESSSYTYARRPVKLVWASEETQHYYDALRWERQITGWSRVKKQALIRGEFDVIHEIVKAERKGSKRKNNLLAERRNSVLLFSSRSASDQDTLTLHETSPSISLDAPAKLADSLRSGQKYL